MHETWVWSLGWEDALEKGKATHSSILAWRIPWTVYSPWGRKESDTTEWLSLSLLSAGVEGLDLFNKTRQVGYQVWPTRRVHVALRYHVWPRRATWSGDPPHSPSPINSQWGGGRGMVTVREGCGGSGEPDSSKYKEVLGRRAKRWWEQSCGTAKDVPQLGSLGGYQWWTRNIWIRWETLW